VLKLAQQNFPDLELERTRIHSCLFAGQPYREKDFNHLMSKLLKCLERFIILREWESDEHGQLKYALEASRRRQLRKNFAAFSRRVATQTKVGQSADYLRHYQTTKIAQQYLVDQGKRAEDPYLQHTADWLDLFYVCEKLKLSCSMIARQQVTNESFRVGFANENPTTWPGSKQVQQLAHLYLASLHMLQAEGKPEIFTSFMAQIRSLAPQLSLSEVRELYNHAAFYCTQHIRKGHINFAPLLFDLYQEGIQKGYLLERGTLSPWIYKNITKLGLGLKQFDWVQWFIENYSQYLPKDHQEDALNFNRADLHYYRGEHDEAMLLLHEVEFSDTFYKLGSKEMLIKIYFEKQETEALFAILNSFRIMLLREKGINQQVKSAYLNFIRWCRENYQLKLRPDEERRHKLAQKIRATNSLTSRKWLLEQLND
ncbi:MAG: hypothetical protein D6772_07535, partial [Bacteroidetes bacterium]